MARLAHVPMARPATSAICHTPVSASAQIASDRIWIEVSHIQGLTEQVG